MQPLNDLFSFFENSPGNLVYFLVVAFTILGSLQGAISQGRIIQSPKTRRMLIGLGALLLVQLALFFISSLLAQPADQGASYLPVVDRSAITISVIWMAWLWAFPEESHGGEIEGLLLSLLVIAAGVYSSITYLGSNPEPGSFNTSIQAFFWSLANVFILLVGAVILYQRKPDNWTTGELVFTMLLVGFLIDLIFPPTSGDFSGVLRFFILVTFPFLFTLPASLSAGQEFAGQDRSSVQNSREVFGKGGERVFQPEGDRTRYNIGTKTIQAFLSMAGEIDPAKINHGMTCSISQSMLVELCFLIYPSEDKSNLVFASGYDLIREENINGGKIKKEIVPLLANAVLAGRVLSLQAGKAADELKELTEFLGLQNLGNVLCVPIVLGKSPLGSLLLLSPYSNRVWSADDQAFLTTIAASFAPVIERNRAVRAMNGSGQVNGQSAEVVGNMEVLKRQLEQAQEEITRQKKLLERGNALSTGNAPQMASHTHVEGELRAALIEMAQLQNQLAEANARLAEVHSKPDAKTGNTSAEVVASISQELRQPLTSIIGYADLLLGESVGILGALQRKFIERIRTSTERISGLVDNLIQITNLESGGIKLNPEIVDLNLIIDNAMANTSSQIREKNVALKIDIPENLQPINTDKEVLQQVLIHLLQNAASVSPEEGSVALKVRINHEKDGEYVLLQVTDSGGGIPKDELPKVFSRMYRAENPSIQGLGDTGVGLFIAKTLTEAQGGRISIDTQMGSGSTFNILLPLNKNLTDQQGQKVSG